MRNYKVGDYLLVKLSGGRIVETTIKAIVDTTEGVTASVIWRGNGFDLSWRSSEPIDVTSYEQRRATIAQRRNLVARLRKFTAWQREQQQEPQ
jgi:hypothetical protein